MTIAIPPRLKGGPGSSPDCNPARIIDLDTLSEWASQRDCFGKLDNILTGPSEPREGFHKLREDFHKWASLLELDHVQQWLLSEGSWCGEAFQLEMPDGIRFVQETLRRRLQDLDTRSNPSRLIELWRWAVGHFDAPDDIRSIWDRKAGRLKETLLPPNQRTIPEQEEEFAALLREVADELAATELGRGGLAWAVETLRGLAQERCPEGRPVRGASARIVFAWTGDNLYRRPGMLIPFEFRRKTMGWGAAKADWFTPKEWFNEQFLSEMGSLMEELGDRFPMAVPRDRLPELPRGELRGSSGKFAIAVAQELANSKAKGGRADAIPPWVVVTATARSEGGLTAAPVDLLHKR